jgi:putative protease
MEGIEVGRVFNFFEKIMVAAIEISSNIKLGNTLRFVGAEHDFTEVVDSIQVDGKNVESAKKGDKVGIKIGEKINKGAKVYRVE